MREIHALVIGGGAVGQVIGKHLALAGVQPSLYLKPKYAGTADEGFYLHPTPTFGKQHTIRWDDFKIYTRPEQLAQVHADQVYICTSSTDLRRGWVEQIWPLFRHALWVVMTPGLDDYAYMAKTVPERFLVEGKVGFLAYNAPLPGEELAEGVAYWCPPMSPTMFTASDPETGLAVTRLLEKGGLAVGLATDFHANKLYSTGLTLPLVLSLEARGWDFNRLRDDRAALARLCVAINEIATAIEAQTGTSSTMAMRLKKPGTWRLFLKYGDRFAPIPLAAYYRAKYTKFRAQSEKLLNDFAGLIARHGGNPVALADLRREWLEMRPRLAEVETDITPSGMVVPSYKPPVVAFAQESAVDDDGNLRQSRPPQAHDSGSFQARGVSQAQQAMPPQAQQQRVAPPHLQQPPDEETFEDRTLPPHKLK